MIKRTVKYFSGFIGLIVVAELIFGDWFPPNYGTLQIPRNEVRYYNSTGMHPGAGIAEFRTDEHGFRGNYGGDPAKIDLLVIGNGTTIEQYITEGETWVDYMRKGFRDSGITVNIAAAGYHGQTTIGLARRFDVWFPLVPGLKPKYILAYIGTNELGPDGSVKFDAMQAPQQIERIHDYIRNSSALYDIYVNLRNKSRKNKPSPLGPGGVYRPDQWAVVSRPLANLDKAKAKGSATLAAYKARTVQLIRRIRQFGSIPIIANQHMGYYRIKNGGVLGRVKNGSTPHADTYHDAILAGRTAMQACKQEKAICVDVVFGLELDGPADIYDHVHTAPSGNRKIGGFIYHQIKSLFMQPG